MKCIRAIFFIVLGTAFFGCKQNDQTWIRVRNESNMDFKDVVVDVTTFGNIKSGNVTDYHTLPAESSAYRYAYVNLLAGTNRMILQPIDFVGETPLGKGRFTYVLTIDVKNRLNI